MQDDRYNKDQTAAVNSKILAGKTAEEDTLTRHRSILHAKACRMKSK
jgi:hypothetical protein